MFVSITFPHLFYYFTKKFDVLLSFNADSFLHIMKLA
jgi:hypothetical protein